MMRRSVFGNSKLCGRYRARMGTSGKISLQSFSTNSKASGYMVMIMSSLRWPYSHAHLLDQQFPVLGAGVPPQVQGLEKLVQTWISRRTAASSESPLSVPKKTGALASKECRIRMFFPVRST